MDRLDELALFLAIADAGSLAGAARRLRRSPPAVTRGLAELERRLGLRLVERTTRRLALTDAGRRLVEHARRLLPEYEEAMRDAAGEAAAPRGRLRLSAPLVFGQRHLAPVAMAFLDAYPEVSVELMLADRLVDLVEEGIDVALRISRMRDSTLVARPVGEVRHVVVASPAYLERRGRPKRPEDLAGHEIVLFASTFGSDWRFRLPGGRERQIRVAARFSADRAEVAVAAAREGRGILRTLSYQVAPDLAAGRLVRLLGSYDVAPVPVQLVMPSVRLMAPRVRAFLDFAAPRLAALPELRAPKS
jgi:DNA-binding transcriptional LysR family regulator